MFFVFGPSGQIYRGGPENLSQIAAVRPVGRPQALRTRSMDAETDAAPAPAPLAREHAPVVNLRLHDAVAAYIQTGQGPQRRREPLTLVSDVMSHGALSVEPGTRVNDAWQTLADADRQALVNKLATSAQVRVTTPDATARRPWCGARVVFNLAHGLPQ